MAGRKFKYMGHMLRIHKGIKVLEKRISAEIYEQIRNGKLRSGARLPTVHYKSIKLYFRYLPGLALSSILIGFTVQQLQKLSKMEFKAAGGK